MINKVLKRKTPKYRSKRSVKQKSSNELGYFDRFRHFIGFGSDTTYGTSSHSTKAYQPSKKLKILSYLSAFALICVIGVILFVFGIFFVYSRELPNPDVLLERNDELSTKLFDRNGKPIFEVYGTKNRELIQITDVSQDLINATIAVEDAGFYNHQGFDFLGMLRALKNTFTGQGLQGGSTLTQQVVKNAVLTQERTITRKIKEFSLALQLEAKYSKDEILQMYLNETPYGGQNYGVLTAAKAYFNKHPKDLTVAESAYIAGLPQSPSRYSYFSSDPDLGLERKNYVLYLMNTRGWVGKDGNRHFLDDETYELAKAEELQFVRGTASFEAPHFVFYVKEVLAEMLGEDSIEQGGLVVTTTLDLDLQSEAERIVKEQVEAASYLNVGNGALVALEPSTGQVLAMVGSKDYFGDPYPEGCISGVIENGCVFDPNVNVATSLRQPGSSIKPITYASMLSQGYTAAYPFLDVQTKFQGSSPDKPYIPENYDGIFRGPMSLRRSLANSLNIPAVKALQISGIDNMLDLAERMGVTTLVDRDRYGLALTLGGGETKLIEMTNAFATFANKGQYVQANPIIEIKNSKGDVLYKANPVPKKALSEEVAFLISDILSDDGARSAVFGLGSLLNIPGHQVAVKTGTTDDLRDNYAIGFTNDIAVGVWVGNSNNDRMSGVASGITGATPIWSNFMKSYLNGKDESKFESPKNVEKIRVDSLTGMLPFEEFGSREEWFVKGTEPNAVSDWYQRIEVCEKDEKIASDECKDAKKTKIKSFVDIRAELSEWQTYVDAWIGENYSGKSEYFPPRMKSALKFDGDGDVDKDADPKVEIVNFKDNDKAPLEFRLKVEVSSPVDVDYVRIYLDGNEVTTDKNEPFGYNFKFTSADIGKHEFKVKAVNEKGNDDEQTKTIEVVGY